MTPTRELSDYLAEHDASCPDCDYSLRGLTSDTCPECGLTLTLELVKGGRPMAAWGLAYFGLHFWGMVICLIALSLVERGPIYAALFGGVCLGWLLLTVAALADRPRRWFTRMPVAIQWLCAVLSWTLTLVTMIRLTTLHTFLFDLIG